MQAVVLAAGEGTRMRPLTDDRPKGLVEVAGEPLLTHCFEDLVSLGVSEIVVVIGYRGEAIVERYGDAIEGVPITYARQGEPKGLAHALLCGAPHVEGDFVLMHGDNVFRANLGEVMDRHRSAEADATVLAESLPRAEARETGVIELDDGEPVGVVEKPDDPPSTLATTGFSVLSPAVLDACRLLTPSGRGEYELSDALDLLLYAGRPVEVVRLDGWRANVNTPEDIEAVEDRLGE